MGEKYVRVRKCLDTGVASDKKALIVMVTHSGTYGCCYMLNLPTLSHLILIATR